MAATTSQTAQTKTLVMRAAGRFISSTTTATAAAGVTTNGGTATAAAAGQAHSPAAPRGMSMNTSTSTITTIPTSPSTPTSIPSTPTPAGTAVAAQHKSTSASTSTPTTSTSNNNTTTTTFPPPPIVIPPPPPTPGFLGFCQMIGAWAFLCLQGYALYLVVGAMVYIVLGLFVLGHRAMPLTVAALWIGQSFFPILDMHQDPKGNKQSWLFKEMVRYFNMHCVMETKLDPSKHYLFAQFPHGTVPLAAILAGYFVDDVVPGSKIYCLIHTLILKMPYVRFFMGYWGALPADRESVARAKNEGNANCSIVVGGVKEIFLQSNKYEQLQLRKGFIREALRNGYEIVPMFHFGATRMYTYVGDPAFWRRLSEYLPFPLFLVGGWGYGLTMMPKKVNVVLVVGAPLKLASLYGVPEGQPVAEPDPEKVEMIYEVFKKDLERLYYRHRPAWEDRALVLHDS